MDNQKLLRKVSQLAHVNASAMASLPIWVAAKGGSVDRVWDQASSNWRLEGTFTARRQLEPDINHQIYYGGDHETQNR